MKFNEILKCVERIGVEKFIRVVEVEAQCFDRGWWIRPGDHGRPDTIVADGTCPRCNAVRVPWEQFDEVPQVQAAELARFRK